MAVEGRRETNVVKKGLKASELVKALKEKIKEAGDCEISVNTQDGSSYFLYDKDDACHVIEWTGRDGTVSKTIEIGQ